MKRTVVVILAVLLLVSPLPDLARGQQPAVNVSEHCPTPSIVGVVFVGNEEVDLNAPTTLCAGSEIYWKRDGVEIPGSRGQYFFRDSGLTKGSTYMHERCCGDGSGPGDCTVPQSHVLGRVGGSVCQDLDWSGGTFDNDSTVNVIDGAVLTISGATLKKLKFRNYLGSTTDAVPLGDIRIQDSTLEDVMLTFAKSGGSYLKNSTFSEGDHSTTAWIWVIHEGDVIISGNTFHDTRIEINPGHAEVDPGPRATITQNEFTDSQISVESVRSATTDIIGNQFFCVDLTHWAGNSTIRQISSRTTIANNIFRRTAGTSTSVRVIFLWGSPIARIEYNTIRDYNRRSNESGDIGLDLHRGEVTLTGNILTDNRRALMVYDTQLTAEGNTFVGNDLAVWVGSDTAGLTLHNNCIAGNLVGLEDKSAGVDATNNWWGDPSGPYHAARNPAGTGDAISGSASVFDPWLMADNCYTEPPATLMLDLPRDLLPADGMTQVELHADLSDKQGPVSGATIKFYVAPGLGQVWPASAKTNAQGRATVYYQVPSRTVFGEEGEGTQAAIHAGNQVPVVARAEGASASGNLAFQLEAPRIERVEVVGIGTLNDVPETGKRVALIAAYTQPAGYKVTGCTWKGLPAPVYESSASGNLCSYVYIPPTGPGTHGKKGVDLTLVYGHTASGLTEQVQMHQPFNLFFARDGDDDMDKVPNWFEYWGQDGAVPDLKEGQSSGVVVYNPNLGSNTVGAFTLSPDKIMLGPRAARDDPGMAYPAGPDCPGLIVRPTQGIETAARTIARETQRFVVHYLWNKGAGWDGAKDSDDVTPNNKRDDLLPADNLPDHLEAKFGTRTDDVDSCDLGDDSSSYALNGDQEIYLRTYANPEPCVSGKDWANPGKQAGGLGTTANGVSLVAGMPASRSGPEVGVSPANTGDLLATQPEFASLTGAYSDAGVDSDGDGLHDQLKLSVGLDVDQEEIYNVVAWLEGGSGTQIGWAGTQATLSPGGHTLDLLFDGQLIRESGLDGPYTVSLVELRLGPRELLLEAPEDAHTTAAYGLADFDPPDVAFTGTFSDQGIDSGSDGLYDQLRIDVGLDVQESGTYTITGELSGTHAIAVSQAPANLATGAQTLSLDFVGASIYHNRQDGPYQLTALRVEDASGNQVDFLLDAYTTAGYTYGAFQHSGTTFDAASYGDHGLDSNGNGRYDSLRFSLALDVDQQDTYLLLAHLAGGSGVTIHSLAREVDLAVGRHTVNLDFSGRVISGHGVDGPYTVTSLALLASDGTLVDHHPRTHTTQAYSWTEFEYLGAIYLPLVGR